MEASPFPCSNHVLLTRWTGRSSFCSYIHTAISMLHTAEIHGRRGHVDWRRHGCPGLYTSDRLRARHGENAWEWFFEQPHLALSEVRSPEVWVYEGSWGVTPERLPWNATRPEAIAVLREIVPRYLRWHRTVEEHAAAVAAGHGLDPGRTIAVSHRGTDKGVEAEVIPIERYFPELDRLLEEHPGSILWAQPEERSVAARLRDRYPDILIMDSFFAAPDARHMADAISPRDGYHRALDAVTLMILFSRCRHFVRNASNLADLASGLSRGAVIVPGSARDEAPGSPA